MGINILGDRDYCRDLWFRRNSRNSRGHCPGTVLHIYRRLSNFAPVWFGQKKAIGLRPGLRRFESRAVLGAEACRCSNAGEHTSHQRPDKEQWHPSQARGLLTMDWAGEACRSILGLRNRTLLFALGPKLQAGHGPAGLYRGCGLKKLEQLRSGS